MTEQQRQAWANSFFDEQTNKPNTTRLSKNDLGKGSERRDFRNARRNSRKAGRKGNAQAQQFNNANPFNQFQEFQQWNREQDRQDDAQMFEQQQQAFTRMADEGGFGGIRESPRNRGQRQNEGLDYLRTPQERVERIQESHAANEAEKELYSNPQHAQQRATEMLTDGGNNPFSVEAPKQPVPEVNESVQLQVQPKQSAAEEQLVEEAKQAITENIQKVIQSGEDPSQEIDRAIDQGVITPDQGYEYQLEHLGVQEALSEEADALRISAPALDENDVVRLDEMQSPLIASDNMSQEEFDQLMDVATDTVRRSEQDIQFVPQADRFNAEELTDLESPAAINDYLNEHFTDNVQQVATETGVDPQIVAEQLGQMYQDGVDIFDQKGFLPSLSQNVGEGWAKIKDAVGPAVFGTQATAEAAHKDRVVNKVLRAQLEQKGIL